MPVLTTNVSSFEQKSLQYGIYGIKCFFRTNVIRPNVIRANFITTNVIRTNTSQLLSSDKTFYFFRTNVWGLLSQLHLDLQGLSSICSQQGLAYKTFNK